MPNNTAVIIVSAGKGKRLKANKPALLLNRKPLFFNTYLAFKEIKGIAQIVMVLRKEHFSLAKKFINDTRISFVLGGKERQISVKNGLAAIRSDIKNVLVHDGARPFVTKKIILDVIAALKSYPAVICGVYSRDTVKLTKNGFVLKTLKRNSIFLAQTPQGFHKNLLIKAYGKLGKRFITDEAMLLESFGQKIKIIEGSPYNFKITYPEDIRIAEAMLKAANSKSEIRISKYLGFRV